LNAQLSPIELDLYRLFPKMSLVRRNHLVVTVNRYHLCLKAGAENSGRCISTGTGQSAAAKRAVGINVARRKHFCPLAYRLSKNQIAGMKHLLTRADRGADDARRDMVGPGNGHHLLSAGFHVEGESFLLLSPGGWSVFRLADRIGWRLGAQAGQTSLECTMALLGISPAYGNQVHAHTGAKRAKPDKVWCTIGVVQTVQRCDNQSVVKNAGRFSHDPFQVASENDFVAIVKLQNHNCQHGALQLKARADSRRWGRLYHG